MQAPMWFMVLMSALLALLAVGVGGALVYGTIKLINFLTS